MPSLLKMIKHTHTTTYITSKPCSPILFLLDYNNQSGTWLATIYCPKPRNGNLCINFPYLHALGLWDGFLSASVNIPTECSGSTYQVHLPVTTIRSESRACSVALLALLTAGSNEVRFTFLFIRVHSYKCFQKYSKALSIIESTENRFIISNIVKLHISGTKCDLITKWGGWTTKKTVFLSTFWCYY